MSGKIQFSILRYRHSYIVGEIINIGILFLFDDGEMIFHYPSKLERISKLYGNISTSFIKNSLASIKNRTNKVNKGQNNIVGNEVSLKYIIEKYFLSQDAGALFFSDIKSGLCIDRQATIEFYYNLYLSSYDKEVDERKSERFIMDQFRNLLKKRFDPTLEKKIKVERTLSDEKKGISEKFDYGWKNEQFHLVTPISFDLKDEQNISNKSMKYFALFNVLKTQAIDNNLKFDLLITKPEDKSLIKNYVKAIDFIQDSGAPIDVIEEEEFKGYVKHLGEEVLGHE
jgi:hypothetical protein